MDCTFDHLLSLDNKQLYVFIEMIKNIWWRETDNMIFDIEFWRNAVEIYKRCVTFDKSKTMSLLAAFSQQKIVYTDLRTDDGKLDNKHALLAAAFSQQFYRLRYQYFFNKREALIDFVGDDAFAAFADDDMDFHIQPHIAKQYGIRNIKLEQQQQ